MPNNKSAEKMKDVFFHWFREEHKKVVGSDIENMEE